MAAVGVLLAGVLAVAAISGATYLISEVNWKKIGKAFKVIQIKWAKIGKIAKKIY